MLHHKKHHQAYITNLNIAEEKFQEAKSKNDLSSMIAIQPSIRFNGGGIVLVIIYILMYCLWYAI